jgi:GNAT superfamily N-acetyltransferase
MSLSDCIIRPAGRQDAGAPDVVGACFGDKGRQDAGAPDVVGACFGDKGRQDAGAPDVVGACFGAGAPDLARDAAGAYHVCLKTGDHGQDGEPFYREDPNALGRIFVGPYLVFEPELSLILEDGEGICGYALGAFDSKAFYARYEAEWRPQLCARFAEPQGDPSRWTRVEEVYHWYHHPDYFCPEPYDLYPSHLHIDLLLRARGRGYGRRMIEELMDRLRGRGSPGAHLGVSLVNTQAFGFYQRLGFKELVRVGSGRSGCIYMGKSNL